MFADGVQKRLRPLSEPNKDGRRNLLTRLSLESLARPASIVQNGPARSSIDCPRQRPKTGTDWPVIRDSGNYAFLRPLALVQFPGRRGSTLETVSVMPSNPAVRIGFAAPETDPAYLQLLGVTLAFRVGSSSTVCLRRDSPGAW